MADVYLFPGAVSPNDIILHEWPYDLIVSPAIFSHASDNIDLNELRTLAVDVAEILLESSTPTTIQAYLLAIAEAVVALESSTPTLNELRTLAVDAASLSLSADAISVYTLFFLAVQDALATLAAEGNLVLPLPLILNNAAFMLEVQEIMMLALTESVLDSEEVRPRQYCQNMDPRNYIRDADAKPRN